MKKIYFGLIVLIMLSFPLATASAQVSIGIGLPNVSIGINIPLFPELVPVPGYPVYYAPYVNANYFFYDGMYWVFWNDNWYASSWYNGPWAYVGPEVVPLFILRVPVRYYRRPPPYFHGWRPYAPPRWGEHWGRTWEHRHRGWDKWNRRSVPAPAPLPAYQRRYSGDRYPRMEQQHSLHNQNYRYQPRETIIRQHYKERRAPAPGRSGHQVAPPARGPVHQPAPPARGPVVTPPARGPVQQAPPPARGPVIAPPARGPVHQPTPPARGPVHPDTKRTTPHQQQGPAYQDQRRQPGGEVHRQQSPKVQVQEQKMPAGKQSQEPRGHGQEYRGDGGHGQGHNN